MQWLKQENDKQSLKSTTSGRVFKNEQNNTHLMEMTQKALHNLLSNFQLYLGKSWKDCCPNEALAIKFYNENENGYQLTNFYPSPFEIDGKIWKTAEHYFQAMKFDHVTMNDWISGSTLKDVKRLLLRDVKFSLKNGLIKSIISTEANKIGKTLEEVFGNHSGEYLNTSHEFFEKTKDVYFWGIKFETLFHCLAAVYYMNQKVSDLFCRMEKARECFELARLLENFRDKNWHEANGGEPRKVKVMRIALWNKFDKNKKLLDYLMNTGNDLLVEHTEKDAYWGDNKDGSGKNVLGKLLMETRANFKKKGENEILKI